MAELLTTRRRALNRALLCVIKVIARQWEFIMAKDKKTGKLEVRSPYKRYNKEPFRYSAEYNEWFRKVTGRTKAYNGPSFNR